MGRRVGEAVAALGGRVEEADPWAARAAGRLLCRLPPQAVHAALLFVARRTLRRWRRLRRAYPDGDARLLADLVAHERAQVMFAMREAAGRDDSLEPVRRILTVWGYDDVPLDPNGGSPYHEG